MAIPHQVALSASHALQLSHYLDLRGDDRISRNNPIQFPGMFGDFKTTHLPVTHGASLAGYPELAHRVGLDAIAMLRLWVWGGMPSTIRRLRSVSRPRVSCSRP